VKKFDPKYRKFDNNFNRNTNNQNQGNRRPERKNSSLSPYEESCIFFASMPGPMVKAMDGESNDQLIRRFKKVVEYSGLLHELKKREFYLSKSQKVKDKKRRALKKLKKRMKRINPIDEDRK
jgi:ribosomal protein S21